MKKKRIIPVILLKNSQVIQSKCFNRHQFIGNPFESIVRYSNWNSDEIIYLNINSDFNGVENMRVDLNDFSYNNYSELTNKISEINLCPITIGGGIHNLNDARSLFLNGADKISFCSEILDRNINLFNSIYTIYGSQSLVAVLDIIKENDKYYLFDYRKKINTFIKLIDGIRMVEDFGFGEIVIQDILNDGKKQGFDLDLFKFASVKTNLPVIALGGAGDPKHFFELFENTDVDGAAAANYFQHSELSILKLREVLINDYNLKYIRK